MAFHNVDLIEKMRSEDRDFRFMAVNDLIEALNSRTIMLDDNSENVIIQNLMKLLNDTNAEVQNLVVRCIAIFASHLTSVRALTLLDSLCTKLGDSDPRTRDAAAIAMRSAVGDFNSTKGVAFEEVVQRITPSLVRILEVTSDVAVIEQVLDIFVQIFLKTGNKYEYPFDKLVPVFFKHTQSERSAVRKRAQIALAQYAQIVENNQFTQMIGIVYDKCVENKEKLSLFKTYIATTTSICLNGGHRFGPYIPTFCEFFLSVAEESDDDELRDILTAAFETFIQRCPENVGPFVSRITTLAIKLLSYDPNYSYEDESDEMEVDDPYVLNELEDDSDYSDDDDVSWKVRRSAAKCIEALITRASMEELPNYMDTFGRLLIKRMNEREDNVKLDILNAYIALLKQVRMIIPENVVPLSVRTDSLVDTEFFQPEVFAAFLQSTDKNRMMVFLGLQNQLHALIARIATIQKTKNSRVLERSFSLLQTLLLCYPGSIGKNISVLKRGLNQAFAELDGNLKLDALRFLGSYFATHDPASYDSVLDELINNVSRLLNAPFSKVASEAVEVLNTLTQSLGQSTGPSEARLSLIYDLLSAKLQISDLDQEVKEKTIYGMGLYVSAFGDRISVDRLNSVVSLLADRLGNEITRIASLKALSVVAHSPKPFNINSVAQTIVPFLGDFLRKVSRSLRIHTLNLAHALAARSPNTLANVNLATIVENVPLLLDDLDLQIAHLSLNMLSLFISQHPLNVGNIVPIVTSVINIAQSSLIQGTTQQALLNFFSTLEKSSVPGKPNFEAVVTNLIAVVSKKSSLHRNAYSTLAKSIAVLSKATENAPVVSQLTKELKTHVTKGANESIALLGILTIGEIGRVFPDVYEVSGAIDPAVIAVNCFNSTAEDLKTGASQALGALAVGNIQRYLPFILEQIKQHPSRQYLLIYALRELVTSNATDQAHFETHIDTIWEGVVSQAKSPEISTRVIVAECLGKLALAHAEKFLPALVKGFQSDDATIRTTMMIAVRYMIVERPVPADAVLANTLNTFIAGIKDDDLLGVRRQAIVLITAVAHFKPALIRHNLSKIMPLIYVETTPRTELQHEVEMGPFKHLVDDGLELRKSAFECLYTFVEHCLDCLNMHEFVSYIAKGIADSHDIALLAYLTIIRLSKACPLQLSPHIDNMTETMKETLIKKPKQNSVKLENDKCEELKRCVVRTMLAFRAMPTHDKIRRLQDLFEFVSHDFAAMLAEVKHEVESAGFSAYAKFQ